MQSLRCWVWPVVVIGLLALQYSDRLDGLLACWVFAAWFLLCLISPLKCAPARWFLDVSFQSVFDSDAEDGIRLRAQNCDLRGLVPPFWDPGLQF